MRRDPGAARNRESRSKTGSLYRHSRSTLSPARRSRRLSGFGSNCVAIRPAHSTDARRSKGRRPTLRRCGAHQRHRGSSQIVDMTAPSTQSQSRQIHPSAVVSPNAEIGSGCVIGPYTVIGDHVVLGNNVSIDSHCVIDGRTSIGDETHIYPFVSIGLPPQDLKFAGEETETQNGRRTRIREFVTIHRGTTGGGRLTKIGDCCAHVAQTYITIGSENG